MASQTRLIYEFDDFHLEPDQRKLVRGGQVVPLHGKAFEMLLVLIRNRGRLLTKEELFELVWPDQIVEESNLTVNMSAIRRALGERASHPRYIATISGQGYRFTGEVRQFADETLTIERETFARLTVEQEETETVTGFAAGASQISKAIRRFTSHPLLLTALAVAILTLAGGGLWLRKLRGAATAPLPWTSYSMRRFAVNGGVPYRVAIAPDAKSIAYVQRINGKFSLWLGQVETNSSVLIEDKGSIGYQAITFARDGQTIYATETDNAAGTTKLVRMPAIGGVPVDILSNINSVVTQSPDGQRLAFFRRQNHRTSIITASNDGKDERVLATHAEPRNFTGSGISWSGDGKFIAVATSTENHRQKLLLISTSDGSEREFGGRDWGLIANLVWQSDGILLMAGSNEVARHSEIWFVPYPTGDPRRITSDVNQYYGASMSASVTGALAVLTAQTESEVWLAPNRNGEHPRLGFYGTPKLYEAVDGLAWTPDGHLLFSGYVGDAQDIWESAPDGSNRRQLTSNSGDTVDRQMTVSADNRYIVFESNRSGSFEIWRSNRDGSNLKQLTSGGGNSFPDVSPDSKWIVFTSDRGGTQALWRISIDGGPATQLTHYSSSRPQVSPDGKRIAYLGSSDTVSLHLGVISFDGGEPEKLFPLTQQPRTNLAKRLRWTPDGKAIIYKSSIEGIWRQQLDRDAPELMPGFEDSLVYEFAWSFDGKNLAYTRGTSIQDILVLQSNR
jgi:Tol biopolymer transport system component/DNA-binding winged helix-turn-helix (wHTH) protein